MEERGVGERSRGERQARAHREDVAELVVDREEGEDYHPQDLGEAVGHCVVGRAGWEMGEWWTASPL